METSVAQNSQTSINIKIMFQGHCKDVTIQPDDYNNFPHTILISLITNQNTITIKSNVSQKIFQSVINYFSHKTLPAIQSDDELDEYDQISKELNIIPIINLVESKKNFMNESQINMHSLHDDSITDKSEYEHKISQNIDDYLIHFGKELITAPIQSLINIFSYQDCSFTQNDLLYELILSHFQEKNDDSIFSLLQFIDGNSLSQKNLTDSFNNRESHYNFMPKFNLSSLLDKIQELEELNQNYKLIIEESENQRNIQENLTNGNSGNLPHENQENLTNGNSGNSPHGNQGNIQNTSINVEKSDSFTPIFQEIVIDNTNYILNQSYYSAEIILTETDLKTITIQRYVEYKSVEYLITRLTVQKCSSSLEEIIFPEDSEVQEIIFKGHAFIKKITIPQSVEKLVLQDGASYLDIEISEGNNNFAWINDNLFIGKSDPELDSFDTLLYARKSIERATIPSYIKQIEPCCFSSCKNLSQVDIPADSNLQSIGEYAFSETSIEEFKIPLHVAAIEPYTFQHCLKLRKIECEDDAELRSIGKEAFLYCPIQSIMIPKNFDEFKDGWCIGLSKLSKVIVSGNNRKFTWTDNGFLLSKADVNFGLFETLVFASREIEIANIPSFIKEISPYCFQSCSNLQKVQFLEDTNLQIIGHNAFERSTLNEFTVPPHVKTIEGGTFFECNNLLKVSFADNSELESIGKNSFAYTPVNVVVIPSHVKTIGSGAFDHCPAIDQVEFRADSELNVIGSGAFAYSDLRTITIPPHVKTIKSSTFCQCSHLQSINFTDDSELESIEKDAFYESSLESITIPKKVKVIKTRTFSNCNSILSIDFAANSELRSIEEKAFDSSSIDTIHIPDNIEQFDEGWSNGLSNIKNIIISPNNQRFAWISNNDLLVGKSDPNLNQFDILVFARRGIEEVHIPESIKRIISYCFCNYTNVRNIEFLPNSSLESIGKYAFSNTSIRSFTIPPHVAQITECTFYGCRKLEDVKCDANSELLSIDKKAFASSSVQSIEIPANFAEFKEGWCNGTSKLVTIVVSPSNRKFSFVNDKYLVGKSDPALDVFDTLILVRRNATQMLIPDEITRIEPYSFYSCGSLTQINFSTQTKLKSVGKSAFVYSSIKLLVAPPQVLSILGGGF